MKMRIAALVLLALALASATWIGYRATRADTYWYCHTVNGDTFRDIECFSPDRQLFRWSGVSNGKVRGGSKSTKK